MKYFASVLFLGSGAFLLGGLLAEIVNGVISEYNTNVDNSNKRYSVQLRVGNGEEILLNNAASASVVYEDGSIYYQPAIHYAPVFGGSGQLTKLQLDK